MWMVRLVGRLIPQPGMYLVLDAPAEILQQRKQEVSFVASKHQRLAYLRLASSIPNAVVIDASEPPEQRGCEGRHERTRIRERAQQLTPDGGPHYCPLFTAEPGPLSDDPGSGIPGTRERL